MSKNMSTNTKTNKTRKTAGRTVKRQHLRPKVYIQHLDGKRLAERVTREKAATLVKSGHAVYVSRKLAEAINSGDKCQKAKAQKESAAFNDRKEAPCQS